MNVTCTVTDITKGPFSVYKALTGVAQAGLTVLPAVAPMPAGRYKASTYLGVQNPPTNGSGIMVFRGDASTKNDGTSQAAIILNGTAPFQKSTPGTNSISLANEFFNASANETVVNIEVEFA